MASSMTKDLRKKSTEELVELVIKMKEQLLQNRFATTNGEVDKPHIAGEIRKTIARALTIINERKIETLNQKKETSTKGASK